MALVSELSWLSGVGPVIARSMVKTYGTSILEVLDSPSAASKLTSCHLISSKFALLIKQHWDESRGIRSPSFLAHDYISTSRFKCCPWLWWHDTWSKRVVCLAGTRDARAFLKKLGVGGKLAQTLVERYGVHTEACLRKDPYSALFSIPGVSFRCCIPFSQPSICPQARHSLGSPTKHAHLYWERH